MKKGNEFLRKVINVPIEKLQISENNRVLRPQVPDYKFLCDPINHNCKLKDHCFLYQNANDFVSYSNGWPVGEDKSFGIGEGLCCDNFLEDPFKRYENKSDHVNSNIFMVDMWSECYYQDHKLDLINLYYVDYK